MSESAPSVPANLDGAGGIQSNDIDSKTILLAGGIAALLTLLAILFSAVLYFQYQGLLFQTKIAEVKYADADETIDRQKHQIESFGISGVKPGGYTVSVGHAAELVLKDLQSRRAAAK